MTIAKTVEESTVNLTLSGRLDTVTAPQLSSEIEAILKSGSYNLVFDFEKLEYISSAGLRIMLAAQKSINGIGTKMEIRNMSETVKEVFDMTGFSGILTII